MAEYIEIRMPVDSQEGTTSVIESWMKNVGDIVHRHEPLLEINTDKVAVEIPAPDSGVLVEILKQPGESVSPGELIGRIQKGNGAVLPSKEAQPEAPEVRQEISERHSREMLSPAVRRMVAKHGIDRSLIKGSGRDGRVTVGDVERFLSARMEGSTVGQGASRMIPHSQMRRRIAEHMVQSLLKTAPHVTDVFEADLSAVIRHRNERKSEYENRGVKLTFTAYFVQAAVKALMAVPEANSRWHDDALEVFTDCNIGVATALENGLIVPVIHKAQHLDLFEIARSLQDLTIRGRSGQLSTSEVQGGTFTITNHGMTGSLIATPIINQPQSAILGIGAIQKRAIVEEEGGADVIRIKPMAYVTLTIDHRVLDGFKANEFLQAFVQALHAY